MTRNFVVDNPNGQDLEFDGELLVDTHEHDVGHVKVFRASNGPYVLRQRRSERPGIVVLDRAETATSADGIFRLLGFSPGAKRVAEQLGIIARRKL